MLLDLLVTNISELIGDIKIGGSLGCRDHVILEHAVLRDISQVRSKVRLENFWKAEFQLFRGCQWDALGDCS